MKKIMKKMDQFFFSNGEIVLKSFNLMNDFFKNTPSESIGLSFNGGKDSTASLFLTLYFLEKFSEKKLSIA